MDCWELMRKINNPTEADAFVAETKAWFWHRVDKSISRVKQGRNEALTLKNSNIISAWKNCYEILGQIKGCLEATSKIDLKRMHNECVAALMYAILKQEEGLTYLDRLEDYIQKLWIETSILVKIEAGKIIKSLADARQKEASNNVASEIKSARDDYNFAVRELKELDAFYTKKLQKALDSDKILDQKMDEFEKAHPDLSEEEFEEAFDQYWTSCPEYCEDDYSDVREEYNKARKRQLEKIDLCKSALDAAEDNKVILNKSISENLDITTLLDVIREYAIAILSSKGYITYPNTPEEKMLLLEQIPDKVAIQVFTEAVKAKLPEEDVAYLN
jgi:hypothetical protein